ncbi:MAG: hypothetical protein KC668_26810 [Myxococcales bacterium]|nr:hypothetical protein [Myxococcales bacterium]
MCTFITATLPASADTPRFRALVQEHGLAFAPLHNAHVSALLTPSERYYRATRAHCDCGSSLRGPRAEKRLDSQIAGLRAKGWSESKIDKWRRSKEPGRPRERGRAVHEPTYDAWVSFLAAALALDEVRHVGLLQHHYRGAVTDEVFQFTRAPRTLAEVREGSLAWKHNVLYEVRDPARYERW